MAGCAHGASVRPYIEVCAAIGYEPRGAQGVAGRELLVRGSDLARTHHLNLVEMEGIFWHEHLDFRNRLRADSALAASYATLKRDLVMRHGGDRGAYTSGKASFVAAALYGADGRAAGRMAR